MIPYSGYRCENARHMLICTNHPKLSARLSLKLKLLAFNSSYMMCRHLHYSTIKQLSLKSENFAPPEILLWSWPWLPGLSLFNLCWKYIRIKLNNLREKWLISVKIESCQWGVIDFCEEWLISVRLESDWCPWRVINLLEDLKNDWYPRRMIDLRWESLIYRNSD